LVVVSSLVFFVIEVTVTLAPATAFPCGSVTVPAILPYTACPEAVVVHSKNAKQQTKMHAKPHPRLTCFLITPLLNTRIAEKDLKWNAIACLKAAHSLHGRLYDREKT
jgi:hypothetical protein